MGDVGIVKVAPEPQFTPLLFLLFFPLPGRSPLFPSGFQGASCTFDLCMPYLHLHMVTVQKSCFRLNSVTSLLKFKHCCARTPSVVVPRFIRMSNRRQKDERKERCEESKRLKEEKDEYHLAEEKH